MMNDENARRGSVKSIFTNSPTISHGGVSNDKRLEDQLLGRESLSICSQVSKNALNP